LCEILTEAYQPALERAALEAFEGRYDEVELGQKVDRATIEQKALELIVAHQEGQALLLRQGSHMNMGPLSGFLQEILHSMAQ